MHRDHVVRDPCTELKRIHIGERKSHTTIRVLLLHDLLLDIAGKLHGREFGSLDHPSSCSSSKMLCLRPAVYPTISRSS